MYLTAQFTAVPYAMRKRTAELLHSADCIGKFRGNQFAEVARDKFVAVAFRRLKIRAGLRVFANHRKIQGFVEAARPIITAVHPVSENISRGVFRR